MTGIFDTHSHYADSAFDEDREQVLEELPRKGVKLVMLAGSSLEDSAENSAPFKGIRLYLCSCRCPPRKR